MSVEPSGRLRQRMEHHGIDIELSCSILDAYNCGEFDNVRPVSARELPDVDGSTVINFTRAPTIRLAADDARSRLAGMLPPAIDRRLDELASDREAGQLVFDRDALRRLGLLLMPRVGYGVLNGGSATSYADETKNEGFSPQLMALLRDRFATLAAASRGRPKGLTPAFYQPDGTLGPSFLELKMRRLLVLAAHSRATIDQIAPGAADELPSPLMPFFQMTSVHTGAELAAGYAEYRRSKILEDLIDATGLDPTDVLSEVQPLIAAYTHSDEGRPRRLFARAWGREDEPLPLPGGHGQSFAVLAPIYRRLRNEGKRFVYLGNVDNLGYLPDPVEVAYLALSGRQAGFDFAYKTPVDVKGGVLVRQEDGRLNCGDIGPAVSPDDIARAESEDRPILFNAATGLFDLNWLVPNLERIARDLPTRFTDQQKDAGRYSQAEQVTWEVIGMLDRFLVFSVSKWDRLLAAKLLCETLMTSGLALDDPNYPESDDPASDLRTTARKLHDGLVQKLSGAYAMRLEDRRWRAIPASELNGVRS